MSPKDKANKLKDSYVGGINKARGKGRKKQGDNDRLDESMGRRNGKKGQSMKDRRDESKGMERSKGRPAYSGNKSSAQ